MDVSPDILLAQFRKKEYEAIFNYTEAQMKLKKLVGDFKREESLTQERRKLRKADVNVKAMQDANELPSDETFIPQREIDANIRKEMPVHMGYLVQSRRLMIFESMDNEPTEAQNIHKLEKDFTRGMKYSMWEKPHYKILDGSKTHGWDSVEVEFDESKPLHAGIDHVGHDNLIFDLKAQDIQACSELIRVYELPKYKLMEFVTKYGFNAGEVIRLIESGGDNKTHFKVYKKFCKYEGVVYVSWIADDAEKFLLEPKKLFMGRKRPVKTMVFEDQVRDIVGLDGMVEQVVIPTPVQKLSWESVYESMYPIFILLYDETEQACIANHVGRVFLDAPNQEARTALVTVFVNGSVRASNVYASPDTNDPSSVGDLQKLDTTLEHGCLYNRKVNFWSPPYPDSGLLRAVTMLQTINQSDTGQIAFAALNRDDSRKTATEITAAQQQNSLLQTVDVIMFSTFLRELYNFVWLIVQSQAMQNLIKFALIEQQDMMGNVTYVNDNELIAKNFGLKAAGDVDVIERAEKLNRRFNMWPIVQATPLAMEFFIDTIKEAFPEDAERYEAVVREAMIQQEIQSKNVIAKMGQMLMGLLTEDGKSLNKIRPEYQQMAPQILQLAQEAQASLAA